MPDMFTLDEAAAREWLTAGGVAQEVGAVVDSAVAAPVIHCPDGIGLVMDYGRDSEEPGFRWLLMIHTPAPELNLASHYQLFTDLARGLEGDEAVLCVLKDGVDTANRLLADWRAHRNAAWIELLATCKRLELGDGSWPGTDVVEALTLLLTRHGFDVDAPYTVVEP